MSTLDENILSLRIVTLDYYLQVPLPELDPCYSQFRGSPVDKVPVVRIFGTDRCGIKTCAHVHGVFPYLYIPYEDSTGETSDQFTYQVACGIDKAINISLGQTHSVVEHVFKIVHVKGIPFYGFHPKEHQFLKIYLYNPLFVRRVANLLQNGAILGKVYQPHESHVPFGLQFLIDYNLYGMSFMHVPVEAVCHRKATNEIVTCNDLRKFTANTERTAVSRQEIDVGAAHILNRFEMDLPSKPTDHANPGIASIWKDEQVRRSRQPTANFPTLEIPPLEMRPLTKPTESDVFFRDALNTKLKQIDDSHAADESTTLDQTCFTGSLLNETKNKFNLKHLLVNSVYPAECSQQSSGNILNASLIINHQSSRASGVSQPKEASQMFDSFRLDQTLVDEDIVHGLSQKQSQRHGTGSWADVSLNEAEFELLEVMQQLESKDSIDHLVDDDSTLAPLSQTPDPVNKINCNYTANGGTQAEITDDCAANSDDDVHNDFSICFDSSQYDGFDRSENPDETTHSLRVPQLDGVDDPLPPNPRSHKSSRASRYPELNVTVCQSPNKAAGLGQIIELLKDKNEVSLEPISKRAKPNNPPPHTEKKYQNGNNDIVDLTISDEDDIGREDVSFMDCRLRATQRSKQSLRMVPINTMHEQLPEVNIALENHDKVPKPSEKVLCPMEVRVKLPKINSTIESMPIALINDSPKNALVSVVSTPLTPRYDLRNRNPPQVDMKTESINKPNNKPNNKVRKKALALEQSHEWSNCEVARQFDILHNFFPEPGPSHVYYYGHMDLSVFYNLNIANDNAALSRISSTTEKTTNTRTNGSVKIGPKRISKTKSSPKKVNDSIVINTIMRPPTFDSVLDAMPNYGIPYSCEYATPLKTISTDDLEEFRSDVVPGKGWLAKRNVYEATLSKQSREQPSVPHITVLKSLLRPPHFDEVLDAMPAYEIPYCSSIEPFYGDTNDVTSRKEISHSNVLHIPTQTLNDMGDFISDVEPGLGFVAKRNEIFKKLMGSEKLLSHSHIRCKLASSVEYTITPSKVAPNFADAARWIQKRTHIMNVDPIDVHADSPIMIPRIEPALTIDDGDDVDADTDVIEMSNTDPIDDDDVIELSPTVTINSRSLKPKNRLRHRDLQPAQRLQPSGNASPSLFGSPAASADSRLSTPNTFTDEVICVDDDDDVVVCQDVGSSQLFSSRRGAKEAVSDANVLVTSAAQSYTQSSASFADHSFGISGATLNNTFGFKINLENLQTATAHSEYNYLTIMSLEIHVRTRGALRPDPQHDEIICMFYHIQNNSPETAPVVDGSDQLAALPSNVTGVIINEHPARRTCRIAHTVDASLEVQHVYSEPELLLALVQLIGKWDPDIFAGYEIEMASWGYVLQRGQTLNINLPALMSRVPANVNREVPQENEEMSADWGGYTQFEVKLCGRIFLDVWRLMRPEIALTSYTFESVMFHILHRRCPLHGWRDLTRLWGAEDVRDGKQASSSRWIVVEYYVERVRGNLELLNQLDLIGRTCELAKLFGIQFFEVLSRGSQFRVESMMLRIAKPKNIIPVSPSVQQRAHMRAPEYLPLILEPLSRLYSDSLIVLDFQSLYPSIIIAYNYCFSTCLGRVEHLGQSHPFEFGASQLRISPRMLRRLIDRDLVTISPCGAVFVKKSVREGVLPRMLKEILDTRLMVKQSMKLHRHDALLQRVLHSRQLGLKLMANVTYGYTAANFSGRMPCVEVGDSVVSKGRETLERAIKLVAANARWRSKVIYGDTDSMFVLVPGRTREDAFRIGAEIAEAVTQDNPFPIKLKLEKVYQPSILQTKKRYVGYMFETPDQTTPVYEAKGIETVRRDGCPAVAKMLEQTLKILFETKNVSQVKSYVCRQFTKILSGKMNIQDFIFAKEFRGAQGYKPGACVPSLELSRRWRLQDPRSEPRRGERVPYLVVNGPPGVPLIKLVRGPHEFLADPGLKINSFYYITKVIVPPLNRCLLLIGADASHWFASLPRKHILLPTTLPTLSERRTLLANPKSSATVPKKSTISQYFSTTSCPTDCGAQTQTGSLCDECVAAPAHSVTMLSNKMARLERKRVQLQRVCASCCGRPSRENVSCRSLDCPVLYIATSCSRQFEEVGFLRQVLGDNGFSNWS